MNRVCFSKHYRKKALLKNREDVTGKSKQRLTTAFFVAAGGSKISETVVIWKNKSPSNHQDVLRTFRAKLGQVWYITSQMKRPG